MSSLILENQLREKLKSILTSQEIVILGYLYALNSKGIQLTNKEISDYWQVSPSRIVKLNSNLISKLQRPSVKKLLIDYVSNSR